MDYREIENQLESRGASTVDCPCCGNDEWGTADVPAGSPRGGIVPFESGENGLTCAVLLCTNCGFVRMHAVGILNSRLAALTRERGYRPVGTLAAGVVGRPTGSGCCAC
jgi:hypothetical protein